MTKKKTAPKATETAKAVAAEVAKAQEPAQPSQEEQRAIQLQQLEMQLTDANSKANTPLAAIQALLSKAGVTCTFDALIDTSSMQVDTALVFTGEDGQEYKLSGDLMKDAAQQLGMSGAVVANVCSAHAEELSAETPSIAEEGKQRMANIGVNNIKLVKHQVSEVAVAPADA